MDVLHFDALVRIMRAYLPICCAQPFNRGEDPVGPWQVRVSDKFTSDSPTAKKGAFLGFSITLWGCAKKASSKHKLYEMPRDDHNVFPPPDLAKKDARSVSIGPLH